MTERSSQSAQPSVATPSEPTPAAAGSAEAVLYVNRHTIDWLASNERSPGAHCQTTLWKTPQDDAHAPLYATPPAQTPAPIAAPVDTLVSELVEALYRLRAWGAPAGNFSGSAVMGVMDWIDGGMKPGQLPAIDEHHRAWVERVRAGALLQGGREVSNG